MLSKSVVDTDRVVAPLTFGSTRQNPLGVSDVDVLEEYL